MSVRSHKILFLDFDGVPKPNEGELLGDYRRRCGLPGTDTATAKALRWVGGRWDIYDDAASCPHTPDELAHYEDEAAAQRQALVAFAEHFDQNPEAVAAVFVALALVSVECATDCTPNDVALALVQRQDEAELSRTLELAATAGFCFSKTLDDGDGDGPPQEFWSVYYLDTQAVREVLMHGARRWLEQKCKAVRPAPVPAGVTREEVLAYLKGNNLATVDVVMSHYEGTGEVSRPIDRAVVAETLLEDKRRRLGQAVAALQRLLDQTQASAAYAEYALANVQGDVS